MKMMNDKRCYCTGYNPCGYCKVVNGVSYCEETPQDVKKNGVKVACSYRQPKPQQTQISLFDMPVKEKPKINLTSKHPVWEQETDSVIGYAQYISCSECGVVVGCRFTYREDIWYHNECQCGQFKKELMIDGVD